MTLALRSNSRVKLRDILPSRRGPVAAACDVTLEEKNGVVQLWARRESGPLAVLPSNTVFDPIPEKSNKIKHVFAEKPIF